MWRLLQYRLRLLIPFILLILVNSSSAASHLYKEREYQQVWCSQHNGIIEYRLDDGSRVDCLTEEYAIEFDFASKWAEAVGQSLYYAIKTGKKAGIVLIVERSKDWRHVQKLITLSQTLPIHFWIIEPSF